MGVNHDKKNDKLLLGGITLFGLFSIFIPIDVYGVTLGHGYQNVPSTTFTTSSNSLVQVPEAYLESGGRPKNNIEG